MFTMTVGGGTSQDIEGMFGRLRRTRITARPMNCLLGANRMEFLGHQIGGDLSAAVQPPQEREVRSSTIE